MGNLEQLTPRTDVRPLTISKQEFLSIFQHIRDIPTFSKYPDFLDSKFFKEHYSINTSGMPIHWIQEIQKQKLVKTIDPTKSYKDTYQIDQLNATSSEAQILISRNLQRMLIALGYLVKKDFFPSQEIIDSWEVDETDISVFGFLSNNEAKAIRRFQSHEKINIDKTVGPITQDKLYRAVFYEFHQDRSDDTVKEDINNLKNTLTP